MGEGGSDNIGNFQGLTIRKNQSFQQSTGFGIPRVSHNKRREREKETSKEKEAQRERDRDWERERMKKREIEK